MTTNLMDQYINITKVFIKDFTKLFLEEEYKEEISKEFISTYIDSRIYNYSGTNEKFFYKRIYGNLVDLKNELAEKYDKNLEKTLDDNLNLYHFILYIDGVRTMGDINEFVKSLCEKRNTLLEKNETKGLDILFTKIIKKYIEDKEKFFKSYETTDFTLDIEKYILIDDTYKVKIDYNFRIPYIYSQRVIEEVFNSGTVYEDKLIIEYILLTIVCIKEINNGNFTTKYLVDFANSLLEKSNKLKQSLRVINNQAIQEKIIIKVNYKDYEDNKELFNDLIKDGFKFAIIIDDSFEANMINLKKLNIFDYLLVSEKSENYYDIKYYENNITNTVIYDV